jgi:hypothetical protein
MGNGSLSNPPGRDHSVQVLQDLPLTGKKVSLRPGSASAAPGAPHAVTPPAAHPGFVRAAVRVCGWRRLHPLPLVCPPPAGGRPPVQLFCLRWRCGITQRPIRRVVARRPAGLPPCHTAGHMAVVAVAGSRPFVPLSPDLPATKTPAIKQATAADEQ